MVSMTNSKEIKIEYIHDVICSWCYAFAPRMRKISKEFPNIKILHTAFALSTTPQNLEERFGSKKHAKEVILDHWKHANENDEEHRFNIELMKKRTFDFPYSLPALMACEAARVQGGEEKYWDYFDRAQKAFFTECLNVADSKVLIDLAKDIKLDIKKFEKDFQSKEIKEKVLSEHNKVISNGINGVPAMIINNEHVINGAVSYDHLKQVLDQLV